MSPGCERPGPLSLAVPDERIDAQIAHIDLDCFFVSVERITDPALRGKPVAVGGSAEGRGVVASASYEARKFGVRSAMSTSRAKRLCPGLIVVRGHHSLYCSYSDRLYRRMLEIAPLVERASIDEMYLDFTGCESLHENDLPGFMPEIKRIVRDEFSLPCTVALASNKLIAKIAANQAKPDGTANVPRGTEQAYLAPLPIGVIPGVGRKTEELLNLSGFRIVEDLQKAGSDSLKRLLGAHGGWIFRAANGIGSSRLEPEREAKSISKEETFSTDISDPGELLTTLHDLVHGVCGSMRKKGLRASTISVKYRTGDFKTVSRQKKVEPTNYDPEVFLVSKSLLEELHDGKRKVRLVGVALSDFVGDDRFVCDLFSDGDKKGKAVRAVDSLRKKFGDSSIKIGGSF